MSTQDDGLFLELVLVFQQTAWVALGKIQNPATGKAETNLEAAAHAIDMLGMLKEKTRAALSDPERQILDNALTQLRLNFVEAASEAAAKAKSAGKEPPAAGGSPSGEPGGT